MSVSVAQSFESLVSYMMSLKRLESLSPSLLYPGHGPVVSDACDRIRQYLHHREQRERQASQENSQHRYYYILLLSMLTNFSLSLSL